MKESAPETIAPVVDPQRIQGVLDALYKELDDLAAPDAPALHNFLQDKLVPALKLVHEEVAAMGYYLSMYEDRLADIEDGQGSMLMPEDAEVLVAYIGESLAVLKRLAQEANVSNLQPLIAKGDDALKLVNEIVVPDEDDDPGDADPSGTRPRLVG